MTPIPDAVMAELLATVKVEFDQTGGLAMLMFPATRQLSALLEECGGRTLPHSVDEVAAELEAATWKALPKWRAAAQQLRLRGPQPAVRNVDSSTARPKSRFFRPDQQPVPPNMTSGVVWETKVQMMKREELLQTCRANGIEVLEHPTNNGLTCMRARNALYLAIKRGVALKS